ncbi:hypothetical protein JL720_1240 [Aureococcus anophagefferens]|nr:hypothetical protein JL720_1240 [Aureococcus anophagefferens]
MLLVLCLATAAGLEASCANGSCRTKRLQRSVSVDQIKGGKPPAPRPAPPAPAPLAEPTERSDSRSKAAELRRRAAEQRADRRAPAAARAATRATRCSRRRSRRDATPAGDTATAMRDLASSIARERGPDAAPPPRLVPRVVQEREAPAAEPVAAPRRPSPSRRAAARPAHARGAPRRAAGARRRRRARRVARGRARRPGRPRGGRRAIAPPAAAPSPPPPPPAAVEEEEQVIVIEPADYPAVAGPAGVTVPVEIDGAETRLRAEPGELLIVAAQRFMAAHLTATSGIGCDVGDQLCMIVRLYDALREFDERRKAEAAPAAPRPAAVALTALAGVVAALVIEAQRTQISQLSAQVASAARAALEGQARAAPRSPRRPAASPAGVEGLDAAESSQLEELRQHNELLKSQLKEAGVSAIEKVVSLDEAKERLRGAAARLLGAQGGGYDDEKEVERWDAYIRVHPDHAAEQLAAEATWRADHATANEACRRVVRGFVPPDVFRSGASLASLKSDGLSADAARRVFKHPALWLTRAAPRRIAKCHVADLRGRYAFETLSLLELRAVFASLPEDGAFENDARGDKQAWKASLAAKLKSLAARKADLPPPKRAPACYGGAAAWADAIGRDAPAAALDEAALPFSPDAEDDGAVREAAVDEEPRKPAPKPPAAAAARAATAPPRPKAAGFLAELAARSAAGGATPAKKKGPSAGTPSPRRARGRPSRASSTPPRCPSAATRVP